MCSGKPSAKRQNWEGGILHPLREGGYSKGDGNGESDPLKSLEEIFFVTEQVIWNCKRNTENVFAF